MPEVAANDRKYRLFWCCNAAQTLGEMLADAPNNIGKPGIGRFEANPPPIGRWLDPPWKTHIPQIAEFPYKLRAVGF